MDSLYLVQCRGMQLSIAGTTAHGKAYVVAPDPSSAYKILRKSLDKRDLGSAKERELYSVELIATSSAYPDCGIRLYGKALQEVEK